MLLAAQKGHPDAAAQIKTILESTFAAGNTPCGPASAPVYPTVAAVPSAPLASGAGVYTR